MSINELESKIESLREWENLASEATREIESLKDAIKAEMTARGVEEMEAGRYIVRWTSVLSQRFDSTSFKKELPELYGRFVKQTASRRFTIS